ncbi:TadE/TadG family type IV pilus assembly protein [Rubinisphaera margarita]|uniref:TadE/TadG family type IV pilus assembly protein n=1 Tax=Rubinisphaera margarita TaxID=2909586 RepID=UPI001EE94004|nr:TadE/TadG family type IV pilus assembly protein [Rubinisphaera margarita]MCG6158411.1 pilus assembly protein [Rubinisphaera margarita]
MFSRRSHVCRRRISGRASADSRRAAALVEFAITVPIVFTLFFAALDFCRYYMIAHATEQAAFEGARRGSIPGATSSKTKDAAQAELDKLSLKNATITVTPLVITNATAEVTVKVRLPLAVNAWVTPKVLTGAYVERECTLSREYVTSE